MADIFFVGALIVILIFSVVLHEVAHGVVAYLMGDPTAKQYGRLTLNPKSHIDPIGSVLVPGTLLFFGMIFGSSFLFGWAKPVPYNPFNLRNPRLGAAIIGFAGPATNIIIALLAGIGIRLLFAFTDPEKTSGIITVLLMMVLVNIALAVFNLLPIPPLDGSKVLFSVLPVSHEQRLLFEQYGFFILLMFIFIGGTQIVSIMMNTLLPLFIGGHRIGDFLVFF